MVYLISVLLAGILSFFSPCILPLLPVYLGILLDNNQYSSKTKKAYWQGIIKTLCFILGLSAVFVILGYGAGFLGNVLYEDWFRYLLGGIIIILGIHQMEWITIKKLQFQKGLTFHHKPSRNGFLNAFILGLTFSFGWTPCVGPVLSSVLALAAGGGNGAFQGGLLMIVYTLGLGIPFIVLSFASDFLMKHLAKIKPYMGLLKKIGGFLIILMGLLLMFGNLNIFASLFE
ncbi:thiol-disulfide oxidoreductase-associated membrane protein CcdA2 [Streptococcus macacae]|uniref:Cytochrome C-type biogenesis protein CcdA n=1 Tax=Streptococcus macacae NCTC 11558 TaxID=764298 RepID=G5JWG1_9STRE|nr:thiol-disulfide oxidoreductase-associated membrane protein CcdA2 [Streptococcus macacae]EHJ52414.1 putative cytochrome C-type biogenesis protein CcdA [Streptococcus macacae NCTC 11558]SUN77814.1 cytochrome c-type biogenesis protein [Streptococcus macacae NCTC 11558]